MNFTKVRAVALMACEAQSRMHSIVITPQTEQWVRFYGGSPGIALSKINTVMTEDNETRRIKTQQLNYFVSNATFWAQHVNDLVKRLVA